jgi:hypothetical protein
MRRALMLLSQEGSVLIVQQAPPPYMYDECVITSRRGEHLMKLRTSSLKRMVKSNWLRQSQSDARNRKDVLHTYVITGVGRVVLAQQIKK